MRLLVPPPSVLLSVDVETHALATARLGNLGQDREGGRVRALRTTGAYRYQLSATHLVALGIPRGAVLEPSHLIVAWYLIVLDRIKGRFKVSRCTSVLNAGNIAYAFMYVHHIPTLGEGIEGYV